MECATSSVKAGPMRRISRSSFYASEGRDRAFASAALYRVLALAFSTPEPELVRSIIRECGALKLALRRGALPAHLARTLKEAEEAWRGAAIEPLSVEYSRLFFGAGLVPLREGGFGDGMRFAGQPVDIADVSGFYLAFGFALPESSASPPDHLGAELEFVSLLHLKIALALQHGQPELLGIARSALAAFLKDHLGRWSKPFEAALANAVAAPAYRAMGRLLARAVEADCVSLRVHPVKARVGTGRDPIAGEELVCPFNTRPEPMSGTGTHKAFARNRA
jgi:TorA maturation chaperone TorD